MTAKMQQETDQVNGKLVSPMNPSKVKLARSMDCALRSPQAAAEPRKLLAPLLGDRPDAPSASQRYRPMAHRHGTLIVLLSWVLLSPPILSVSGPDQPLIDLKAPLWKWRIEKTFDSASRCEREKLKRQRDSRDSKERDLSSAANNDAQLDHRSIATYKASAQMKCASTNALRLERK
jgi:hypothetical protein